MTGISESLYNSATPVQRCDLACTNIKRMKVCTRWTRAPALSQIHGDEKHANLGFQCLTYAQLLAPPPKNLSWLSVTSFAAADEPRPNAKASIHTINKNENDGFNNPLLYKHKSEIPLQRKYETRIVYRRKRDICLLSWLKEIPLWIQFILPEKT